jgi:hypothetical protein
MTQYVGLDVSLKETKLHVLDDVADARLSPLRSLRRCVGTLPLRFVSDLRRDH